MRKHGIRLVCLGVLGVCAAFVVLVLFGPNGGAPLPSTQTVARPLILSRGASAAAGARLPSSTPSAAERPPGAPAVSDSNRMIAAEPAFNARGNAAAAVRQQTLAAPPTRAQSVNAVRESGESAAGVRTDGAVPACWVAVSNLPEMYYAVERDERQVWNGSSSARFFAFDDRAQHGLLQQTLSASAFAGQRLEFSAVLKIESAILGVKVWLIGVDSRGTIVAESGTDWLRGTVDWHPQTVVADVPADAAAITLAFRVLGRGTLWVDDAKVAIVARDGTAAAAEIVSPNRGFLPNPGSALPTAPQNLDFEVWSAEAACDGAPSG